MSKPNPADDVPDVSVTHDERGVCIWISVPALAAARITEGPNGPAAPFPISVDAAMTLASAVQQATADRDALRARDNLDGDLS